MIIVCSLVNYCLRTMCCCCLPCVCHIPARKISVIEIHLAGRLVGGEKLEAGIFFTSNLTYGGTSRTYMKRPFFRKGHRFKNRHQRTNIRETSDTCENICYYIWHRCHDAQIVGNLNVLWNCLPGFLFFYFV